MQDMVSCVVLVVRVEREGDVLGYHLRSVYAGDFGHWRAHGAQMVLCQANGSTVWMDGQGVSLVR